MQAACRLSVSLHPPHKSWKRPGLLAVARVRRVVQREKTGMPLTEVHYYLCSIPAYANVLWHWSVDTGVWNRSEAVSARNLPLAGREAAVLYAPPLYCP